METTGAAGGWRRFSGVHGWEAFEIHVLAAVIDGQPRAIGVRVEPLPGADSVALNSANLRRLPVTELARVALAINRPAADRDIKALRDDVAALGTVVMGHAPHANPDLTAAVAAVWTRAHNEGRPTTAAVMAEVPGLAARRSAARYVARAREAGLIPPSTRGGAKPSGKVANTNREGNR